MKNEMMKPGVIVRDISGEYDGPTFDVLFINDARLCRYSNDVFDTEKEAISMAEICTESLVDREVWDYYQHSEYSSHWKLVKRYDKQAA